jgi:hypothetical protein
LANSEKERELQKYAITVTNISMVLSTGIRWGCGVLFAYFGYRSITAIAGQETTFRAILQATFKLDITKYTALVIAGLASGGWRRERLLRRKEVTKLAEDYKALQDVVDPKSLSSGLSPMGEPAKRRKNR